MDTGLFNLLTRQQVYVEGVKNWFHVDLMRYMKLLRDFITQQLGKLGVRSLGDLNKPGLSALLRRIDKRANEILSGFGSEFLSEVRRFGRISATAQKASIAVLRPSVDLTKASLSSIWSATKDRIVPAFGATIKDAANTFVSSARDKIRTRLNTGAVDGEAIGDTADAVSSLDPRGDPSALKTIAAGARGFVSTALQHAVSTASDFVSGLVHDCYMWCSVIDSRTSEICRERNGNVYRRGDGPVPPAHNHCRSHTVPCDCDDKDSPPTFYNWLLNQPAAFLNDALGASVGAKVAKGTFTPKDLPDVATYKALSLDEYELKAPLLTA
jgi:hypothetical protein